MKTTLIILLIMIVSLNAVHAEQFPQPYDSYVNDYAKIFSDGDTTYLRSLLHEVRQNTTAQVVIVTLPSLNGSDISQYATDLGQKWGVGYQDRDNGLVILYTAQENKVFAATGYGLEGILPDSKVGRLLDENYVPLRDSGNVSQGIVTFVIAIAQVIEQNADEVRSGQASGGSNVGIDPFWIFIAIILILTIISRMAASGGKKGRGPSWWWIPLFLPLPRGGGSGGFGGGFGGGGFGGGGFGGGGAGR